MQTKKKVKIAIITLLMIVEVFTIHLMYKSRELNGSELPKVKIKNNFKERKKQFAIMLETSVGSEEYENGDITYPNALPTEGYVFNETKSGCIDVNGKEVTNILSYNYDNYTLTLNTNSTVYCYLYYDVEIPKPDIQVNVTNVPTTVGKKASANCNGSTCNYNAKYNRLEISQVNSKNTNITLNYTERTDMTYLNQYVIDQVTATSSQTEWKVVNENGYRYEGKNPNNYVWFNNELWRIIGVFDETTHGVTNTNLVKIIRANSIGGLVWDKSNSNTWANASLYKLLNPIEGDANSGAYYNGTNGTSSGYCYGNAILGILSGNCDYKVIGIQDAYRGMIQKVTWKLGSYSTYNAAAATFYTAEREGTNSVENYIGLMYASDYGYATLATSCARETGLYSYDTAVCAGKNWLYGQGDEWTLVSNPSNDSAVFKLTYAGKVYSDGAYADFAATGLKIRPVLYLDSNTYLISGDGSQKNPYVIGI